jgi:hypothetical protein
VGRNGTDHSAPAEQSYGGGLGAGPGGPQRSAVAAEGGPSLRRAHRYFSSVSAPNGLRWRASPHSRLIAVTSFS